MPRSRERPGQQFRSLPRYPQPLQEPIARADMCGFLSPMGCHVDQLSGGLFWLFRNHDPCDGSISYHFLPHYAMILQGHPARARTCFLQYQCRWRDDQIPGRLSVIRQQIHQVVSPWKHPNRYQGYRYISSSAGQGLRVFPFPRQLLSFRA